MKSYLLERIGHSEYPDLFEECREVVRDSGLVVYPTDTLYGLGASASSAEGLTRIFETKGRPLSMPVSIAVHDVKLAGELTIMDDDALLGFLGVLFPSRTTVLLPGKEGVLPLLLGADGFLGIRVPDNAFTRDLLRATGPLTSTSANVHGEPGDLSGDELADIKDFMGRVRIFIRSSELDRKLEENPNNPGSTVMRIVGRRIEVLREGEMDLSELMSMAHEHGFRL